VSEARGEPADADRYVVGYSADSGGRSALSLGRVFAATGGIRLAVATVTPTTWGYPSMARVDAEYAEFLASHAAAALEEAKRMLGDDIGAEYQVVGAASAAEGLLDLAERLDARLAVLGSARGGAIGRFTLGSVTGSLLHASPVPVALAPRGYHPAHGTRLRRVSCSYVRSPGSAVTVAAAVELARRHQVPLRLVTGVVRDRQMYPALVGWRSERLVEEQWRSEAAEALREVLAELPPDVEASAEIADGSRWDEALDTLQWEDAEVLVLGSSRLGGAARFLLGGNANKIMRSSPVPTVVVPAAAAATLTRAASSADQAAEPAGA
jgi:nucleotide-binding universal stress UspA family protein